MIGETYYHQKDYREAIRQFLKVDILYDAPPGRPPRCWRREKRTNNSPSGPTPPNLMRGCAPSSPTTPPPRTPRPGSMGSRGTWTVKGAGRRTRARVETGGTPSMNRRLSTGRAGAGLAPALAAAVLAVSAGADGSGVDLDALGRQAGRLARL